MTSQPVMTESTYTLTAHDDAGNELDSIAGCPGHLVAYAVAELRLCWPRCERFDVSSDASGNHREWSNEGI